MTYKWLLDHYNYASANQPGMKQPFTLSMNSLNFTVEHAQNCHYGGFPTIRYDEIRNLIAKLMDDICDSVGVEPKVQPLSDEKLKYKMANQDENGHLDVIAHNFWGHDMQNAYFDIRVINPLARSYRDTNCPVISQTRAGETKSLQRKGEGNRTWHYTEITGECVASINVTIDVVWSVQG